MLKDNEKEILKSLGFKVSTYSPFYGETWELDTHMTVNGSHATDCLYIYYTEDEEVRGFAYTASMPERLGLEYPEEARIDLIEEKIKRYLNADVEFKFARAEYCMVMENDLAFEPKGVLEEMIKGAVVMDYLMSGRLGYLDKKHGRS